MLTHYVKRSKKTSAKLDSTVESLVLQAVPTDRLATLTDIIPLVEIICKKNGEQTPNQKVIANLIELLSQKGFILELHGSRITRWLDTL